MIMQKQTLRQNIAIGIAAIGISLATICGGCADQYYNSPNQGCFKKSPLGELYHSPNCDGNWQYIGLAGFTDLQVDNQGNVYHSGDNPSERALFGTVLGAASAGAFNQPGMTPQQAAALQGTAAGLQNVQLNDAIRNSGSQNTGAAYNADTSQKVYKFDKPVQAYFPLGIKNPPEGQYSHFFTYKKWKDLNNDGQMQQDELFGIGECINAGETCCILYSPGCRMNKEGVYSKVIFPDTAKKVKYKFRVFDPNADEQWNQEGELWNHQHVYFCSPFSQEQVDAVLGKYKNGTYKVVINVESEDPDIGKKTESITFKLCPQ